MVLFLLACCVFTYAFIVCTIYIEDKLARLYGFVMATFIFTVVFGSMIKYPNDRLIRECEKELPRNEYCKLIAVKNNEVLK